MTTQIRKYYYKADPGFSSAQGKADTVGVSLPREPWYDGEDNDIMLLHEQGLSSRQIADRLKTLSSSAIRRYIARRKQK